ncbi:energy transducer TonB [Fluviicola taffensis]|uniref:TonB n=1 Tax=Fluviicola taffensis (strain DSM 16823 / NCIMB 13979 / RW262) TaxID=755732 RepID=F2IC25_FLUTR|nr:energy transducer TonB [Fluviicola taffensis]AEA43251.1 TonB [Fluviicola taffensis DSM 16823]
MLFNFTKSLIFLLSFLSFQSFAQEKDSLPPPEEKGAVVFETPDVPAEFPGGLDSLKRFLSANIKYPIDAVKKKLEGKCYIQFGVSESGVIGYVKIKRGVLNCPECDEEAVRVVKLMPLWKPAQLNGKNVNCIFSLPISFKL